MFRLIDLPRGAVASMAAIGVIVGAGCAGADDRTAPQPERPVTETTAPTPETATATPEPDIAGSAAFPIDAPAGATATQRVDDAQLQLEYPADDFARVVEFYEDWTENHADTYERFDGDDGSVGWRNDRARGEGFRAISVAQFIVGGDADAVTIAVLFAE